MTLKQVLFAGGVGLFVVVGVVVVFQRSITNTVPIRVGILHSLSGTMAISEQAVVDSTLLAINRVNEHGGVLGRMIEPVIADGKSDWPTFSQEAERLITQEKVAVIFGCWTSASRKTVKPVIERHQHILFYPVQYEGVESSPHIIYTGAAPNQQIIPAVAWCLRTLGTRVFVVGSDYVFPRVAHEIIVEVVRSLGGELVGSGYIPLGSKEVGPIIRDIQQSKPTVILNTINGDSNVAFFSALRKAGITPEKIPTMSFSLSEAELASMPRDDMIGNYACWNYFQSVESVENHAFIMAFKERYGQERPLSDPMEAAYIGVHMWAQTAQQAGSIEPAAILKNIKKQSFAAPSGLVYIDPINNHTWKPVRIGKIMPSGQFYIVWDTHKSIAPNPYPFFRKQEAWEQVLSGLYEGWGKKWAKT